ACWSSDLGTVCGVRPLAAGKKNALLAPLTAARAAICQIRACPEKRSAATVAWLRSLSTFDATITRFRGSRSAQMPPSSRKTTTGSVRAASTKPRSAFESVRSSTAKASAMFAKALPTYEVVVLRKRRRNSRSCSGPRSGRRTLVPVALQPRVRLPERHRLLVGVQVGAEVARRGLRELPFARAVADAAGPLAEADAQLGEVALDVLGDAEMDQRQAPGRAGPDLVERPVPRLEVDLRRRRRRQHEVARPDAHAGSVARVQRPVAGEVADVMARVAGGREGREP